MKEEIWKITLQKFIVRIIKEYCEKTNANVLGNQDDI